MGVQIGTNLIAFRCQCSLARRATAFARWPSTFWSLARHPLRHRRRYCPAGELALSPPRYSRWRARLPAPSRRRRRLLAITAIRHSGLLALSSMLQASQLHVAGKQSALLPRPPCKTIDFQHIDKLSALHIVHFAPRILSNKLNFAPCILCNKFKSSSWIHFVT